MSYMDLLSDESVRQQFLAILMPRFRVSGWTVVSGFIYEAEYTRPKPGKLEFDGVEMVEVDTDTPGAGEWFYDQENSRILFRTPESGDPDDGMTVVTFPLYVSTSDNYWNSDPLDDSTDIVYYEPLISGSPSIKSTTTDSLFGFLPTQSSQLKLNNAEHWLEQYLYDCSFNLASVKIYHALGNTLDADNIALVYDGLMTDVNYDSETVTVKTVDRIDEFKPEYRNEVESFYSSADFPNINPTFIGKCIRYVYGYVRGFVPVNVDYVDQSPGTSDNRDWAVIGEQTGLTEVVRTVGGGVHTTTKTFVSFTEGINIGDTLWLDRVSGTDEYVEVTNVSRSPAFIEHVAIASPMANGDSVRKGFVSRVEIRQNNVNYLAMYGRDYTVDLSMAAGVSGFSFSTSLESNLSMPENLSPNDTVLCTVYGRVNDLTAGGPTFGANDPDTNNITNPVMVIYDLMKNRLGIPESRINLTDFAALRTATASQGMGFAIPSTSLGGFQSYKNIIIDIIKSALFRIILDNDQKWTLKALAPLLTPDKEIDSTEIQDGFSCDFEHSDMVSDVIVEYALREISQTVNGPQDSTSQVIATSEYARHVHKVVKQQSFPSLHFRAVDAQELADRLSFVLGDRRATFKIQTRNRFFDSLINDTITVTRQKLPGFEFESGTDRSREVSIIQVSKGLRGTTIEADDQKGIEDNAGSW